MVGARKRPFFCGGRSDAKLNRCYGGDLLTHCESKSVQRVWAVRRDGAVPRDGPERRWMFVAR